MVASEAFAVFLNLFFLSLEKLHGRLQLRSARLPAQGQREGPFNLRLGIGAGFALQAFSQAACLLLHELAVHERQGLWPRRGYSATIATGSRIRHVEQIQLGYRQAALDEDVNAPSRCLSLVRLAPAVAGPRLTVQHRLWQSRINAR